MFCWSVFLETTTSNENEIKRISQSNVKESYFTNRFINKFKLSKDVKSLEFHVQFLIKQVYPFQLAYIDLVHQSSYKD